MGNYNKIILMGRVGIEPKYNESATGVPVARFTLATSRKVNEREITQWHNIVCFKNSAKFVGQYVHKGDSILVEGEMTYPSYKNRAGEDVRGTEVVATIVQIAQPVGHQQKAPAADEYPTDFPADDYSNPI